MLDAGTLKSILDRVTVEPKERADTHDLLVANADEEIHKQVQETEILARAAQACVNCDWLGDCPTGVFNT